MIIESQREHGIMTQDELWLQKWQEAIDFLGTTHSKPSKYMPEERNMRNWWKQNKKLLNAGEMKEDRVALFEKQPERGRNIGELINMSNLVISGLTGNLTNSPIFFLYSTPEVFFTWLFKIDDHSPRDSRQIERTSHRGCREQARIRSQET